MQPDEQQEIGLYLRTTTTTNYGSSRHAALELVAIPVYRNQFTRAGEFRYFSGVYLQETGLADLHCECLIMQEFSHTGAAELHYADIYRLDSRQLEAKCKALKGIERKLERMSEKEGRADTAGMSILRFARAIGATFAVVTGSDAYQRNSGEQYRFMAPSESQGWANAEVARFKVEYPTPEKVTA